MSSLCLFKVPAFLLTDRLKEETVHILSSRGLACFWKDTIQEPFVEQLPDISSQSFFSIADDTCYDNCEMFVLPDGCFYNGRTNSIPFIKRMEVLQDVFSFFKCHGISAELFMGDSGGLLEEYHMFCCSIEEIPNIINRYYFDHRTATGWNLRIVLKNIS